MWSVLCAQCCVFMETTSKSYTELNAWKEARKLVKSIYTASTDFPHAEQFGLTNQIRRAAVSIPSNIAEGIGRNSAKDTKKFLFIARGSLYEVETQLYLAQDLDYLKNTDLAQIFESVSTTRKLLSGLRKHYEKKIAIK